MTDRRLKGLGLAGSMMALALLAGCSPSHEAAEDAPAPDNSVSTVPVRDEAPAPPPVETRAPTPSEPDRNTAEALPAEEPPSPDAQMLEDADAAGLTARTAPDAGGEPAAEPAPADGRGQ